MNDSHRKRTGGWFWFARNLLLAALLCEAPVQAAGLRPYGVDAATLHLWHLDQSAAPATDIVPGGISLAILTNGATLNQPSLPGFGTALSTVDGGVAGTNNAAAVDAYLAPLTLVNNSAGDNVPWSFDDPGTGAFTFEALLRIDFDPAANLGATGSGGTGRNLPMQIISGDQDGSGGGVRSWQFRLDPVGFNPNADGVTTPLAQPALEFINVNNGSGVQNFLAPLPLTGPDAIVSNQWYHVAVTYNGNESTPDNLRFYWTLVDSNRTAAALLSSRQMTADLNDAGAVDLCVGNTGRTMPINNFIGLIDEVRISSVARAAHEFIFRSVSVLAASAVPEPQNPPAATLDGDLVTRWSAQGDGQWITFDLGHPELVEAVDIAFYLGDQRTTTFDVRVSNDNLSWVMVRSNTTSSGVSVALEPFDLPDFAARYVRIVGHGNSSGNDWNSLTEVVIHSSPLVDADADSLPDAWENYYFTNLIAGPVEDTDNDMLPNAYEYWHSTNPTQVNQSGDTDNDGLPDFWESNWFGNLNQTGSDDPDRDGLANLAELQGNSDPTNPNSVPGDTDGDNLPDTWETMNLGGLNYSAYDDADNDSYNNLAEMVAGTSPLNASSRPAWIAPRVALIRDSLVTTDACLMPSGATYGRAINGISFQTKILLTFGGYQYTAWYDTVGTTQNMWLARRAVTNTSVGAWEKFNTGSQLLNGDETAWDAHNVISLGVSPLDGTLHVSWDHHGNTLRYRRSVTGLCTTNKAAWGPGMLNPEQNWLVTSGQSITGVTYPMFINSPSGDLLFEYRTGSTSAGDHWLHHYQPATTNWTPGWKFSAKEGNYVGVLAGGNTGTSTSRNAYENNFDFSPDGTLHHTWTYREAADAANHDIHYAYSTNVGVTWCNNAGAVIADTNTATFINVNSPGIIVKVLDSRQRLINQQAQCVDNDGRVHVLMLHRRAEPDATWVSGDSTFSVLDTAYHHYFRDPVTHVWSQRRIPFAAHPVGSRPKIGFDMQGNVYGIFLAYDSANTDVVPGYNNGRLVIASASRASQYTDWEVVQVLGTDLNGEPLIDQARLLTDNILSVFIQENSATTTVVGTPLHVFEFAVGVAEPEPLSLNFFGPDALVVVGGQLGYTYQLRAATSLWLGDWSDVGSSMVGHGGLLALPEPNGRFASPQRYYRVVRTP